MIERCVSRGGSPHLLIFSHFAFMQCFAHTRYLSDYLCTSFGSLIRYFMGILASSLFCFCGYQLAFFLLCFMETLIVNFLVCIVYLLQTVVFLAWMERMHSDFMLRKENPKHSAFKRNWGVSELIQRSQYKTRYSMPILDHIFGGAIYRPQVFWQMKILINQVEENVWGMGWLSLVSLLPLTETNKRKSMRNWQCKLYVSLHFLLYTLHAIVWLNVKRKHYQFVCAQRRKNIKVRQQFFVTFLQCGRWNETILESYFSICIK